MRIKAYELMAKAAAEPEKYEGKQYKMVHGVAITAEGATHERFTVYHGGFTELGPMPLRLYISDNGVAEEIQQPVTFIEAANSSKKIKSQYWSSYYTIVEVLKILANTKEPDVALHIISAKWYTEEAEN